MLALLVLATVFGPGQHLPVDFLPIPLLMWGAMRLPVRLVTVQLLVAGVVASVMTSLGNGPIAHDLVTDDLPPEVVSAVMQAYLVCLALVVLPLALVDPSAAGVPGAGARAGEERFRRSFSDSLIGMLLLRATPSGLVVDEANGVAAALLGAEPEQLLGRPWGSGLHDEDREAMQRACADILEGRLARLGPRGAARQHVLPLGAAGRLGARPTRWSPDAERAAGRPDRRAAGPGGPRARA